MRYLGLDVSKKYVQACLLNEDGSIVRERRYRYDEDGLRNISFLLEEGIEKMIKKLRFTLKQSSNNV